MTEPLTTKTRLIGKIMADWCAMLSEGHEHIHFDRKLCDGMQNIRFTSDTVNAVFPQNIYSDGYILCYELVNTMAETLLTVKLDQTHIGKRFLKTKDALLSSIGTADAAEAVLMLKCWNISDEADTIAQIPEVLNQLFDYELSYFETELHAWLADHSRAIKPFPRFEHEVITSFGSRA